MAQNAKHRRPKPSEKPTTLEASLPLNPYQKWLLEHKLGDDEAALQILGRHHSVEQLFTKLNSNPEDVAAVDLFALSDLERAEIEYVRQEWPLLPVAQRRSIMEQITQTAEDELDLIPTEFFRLALRDDDAIVRRLAIEGLWEDEGSDLIGPYIQILQNDPDSEVQAAAATALGDFVLMGELDELQPALAMRVEQSLFEILEDPSQPLLVQCRALESIAFSSDEGLRQIIEEAYYSAHEEMRLSALRAMGRSSDIRWRKMVQAELQSPEPAMRAEAAIAAGELEAKGALKELIQLLNDQEQVVRISAIYALGRIGGKQARTILRQIAANRNEEEAEAAEEALEEMLFFSDMADLVEQVQGETAEGDEPEVFSSAVHDSDDGDDLDDLFEDSDLRLNSDTLWDNWSGDSDEEDDDDDDDDVFEDLLQDDELDDLNFDELDFDDLDDDDDENNDDDR